MELLKKSYQISLWDDESVYIITDVGGANRREVFTLPLNNNYEIKNHVYREVQLAQIGSDKNDSPIRAFDPKLKQNVNGTNTLTFKMAHRYFDEDVEEWVDNPFTSLMINERKIKLFYDEEWFDFLIKQIEEDSTNKIFTYTCTDLHINELSKNGYGVEFSNDLENNMGTIIELGDRILEGSDWYVNELESDSIKQYTVEPLYGILLSTGITATCMADFSYGDESIAAGAKKQIAAGQTIWASYSSIANEEEWVQFFYYQQKSSEDDYVLDEDGVILNSPNYKISRVDLMAACGADALNSENLQLNYDYYGNCLIIKQESVFLSNLGENCLKWTYTLNPTETYYSLKRTEYVSPYDVKNLIPKDSCYSNSGWLTKQATKTNETPLTGYEQNPCTLTFKTASAQVSNTGPEHLKQHIPFLTEGEVYVLRAKVPTGSYGSFENLNITLVDAADANKILFSFVSDSHETSEEYTWVTWKANSLVNVSPDGLNKMNLRLVFSSTSAGSVYHLFDLQLFKYVEFADQMVLPGSPFASNDTPLYRDYYKFFTEAAANKATDLSDLIIDHICFVEEVAKEHKPVYDETHEKVRSITASKSNYFNLIQELSETFEVWAKFHIGHFNNGAQKFIYQKVEGESVDGKIYYTLAVETFDGNEHNDFAFDLAVDTEGDLYERKLEKWVAFKEFVGEENWAGFRYGINLKSIKRQVDSKQFTTKLIVQPNSNEHADTGSCSIQRASMNIPKENFIFNFNYYIQNGFLDKRSVGRDLYGGEGGIGYLTELAKKNKLLEPLIQQLTTKSALLIEAQSALTLNQTYLEEAQKAKEEAIEKLKEMGLDENISASTTGLTSLAVKYAKARDNAVEEITEYTTKATNSNNDVKRIQGDVDAINNTLNEITVQKKALNRRFYSKYSAYVQEGTWISEDYDDPDRYYIDAQKVSRTSAFPKVTYTIQVVEISQVDGYQNYNFKVGDKTYIEDVEFFGYGTNGRPYQEEVVVSEVLFHLDDSSQNTITVQNYKTQFEDLFQRIAAATTSLQYNEGKYNRAADVVDDNGVIKGEFLRASLNQNVGLVINAPNGELTIDQSKGAILAKSDKGQLILNSMGILLGSENDYRTAISAEGINADVITTGRLNAGAVHIYADEQETFRWDTNGLNAYNYTMDENGIMSDVNYNNFVRMDRFGVYAYQGDDEKVFSTIDEVVQNSLFSLTRKGLRINDDGSGGDVSIKIGDVFSVGKENDEVKLKISGAMEGGTIKIGPKDEAKTKWNFEITDTGELKIGENFSVDQNGIVTIKNGNVSAASVNATFNAVLAKAFEIKKDNKKIGYFGPMDGSDGMMSTEGVGFNYDNEQTNFRSEVITTEKGARITIGVKETTGDINPNASVYVVKDTATMTAPTIKLEGTNITIGDSKSTIYIKGKAFEPGVAYFA